MAGKSVETTIAYRLDARGLREAKRELEKAFKPDSVKGLNAALKDARDRVKGLSLDYAQAAKASGAMAEYPKNLREGLKLARAEVQKLTADLGKQAEIEAKIGEIRHKQATLAKVEQARARLADAQAATASAQLAQKQRGSAFRQGVYQGIGGPVSRYMQRREATFLDGGRGGGGGQGGASPAQVRAEMRAQFAGQMVGGAIHSLGAGTLRGGRALINGVSGMMGGAGPLSTAFGGVPLLGGAAQLAEGAVGSFVERQRAQLGAMGFVGGTSGSGADAAAARASTLAGGAAGVTKAGADARAAFLASRKGSGTGARLRGAAMAEAAAAAYGKLAANPDMGVFQKIRAGEIPVGSIPGIDADARRAIATEARAIVGRQGVSKLGNAAADAAGAGASASAQKTLDGKADAAAAAAANAPFADMQRAAHGLMSGTEAIQSGTAFTRGVGGKYVGGNGVVSQFEQANAAELSGVDQATSAKFFKGQRAGRGASTKDEINSFAKAIGAATAQDLAGSEIGEYLDSINSLQEDAASRGLKIDRDALVDLGVGLSRGLGLAGPQAGRVAGNIASMAQGIVSNGAKGPMDIQMLRAAGFDPGQGNFLETRRKLAGGMDAGSTFDLLQNLVGGEGDALKRGYTLERSGLGLGTEQALELQERLRAGKGAFMASIGDRKGTAADLIAELSSPSVGAVAGGIRGANAVQDSLVGAGGAAAGNVQALQAQAASLAQTMATALKVPLDGMTKSVVTISKSLEAILQKINEVLANGSSPIP